MNTWERPEFFASDEHRTLEFEGTTLSSRDALTAYLAYFPERTEFSNPKPEAADVAWLDAPPVDVAWLAHEELRAEISSAKSHLLIFSRYSDPENLAYLQTNLTIVQEALRSGAVAVLDVPTGRFLSSSDFDGQAGPENPFCYEDHLTLRVQRNVPSPLKGESREVALCSTLGMKKFGRPNLALTIPEPLSQGGLRAANVLLNEIALALCEGKMYTRDDNVGMNYPSGRVFVGFHEMDRQECKGLVRDSDYLLIHESGDFEVTDSDISTSLSVIERELDSREDGRVPDNLQTLAPEQQKRLQEITRWVLTHSVWKDSETRTSRSLEEYGSQEFEFILPFPCGCAKARVTLDLLADGTMQVGYCYPVDDEVSQDPTFEAAELPEWTNPGSVTCQNCCRLWSLSYEVCEPGRVKVSLKDSLAGIRSAIDEAQRLLSEGEAKKAQEIWATLKDSVLPHGTEERELLIGLGVDCSAASGDAVAALEIAAQGMGKEALRRRVLASLPQAKSDSLSESLQAAPELNEILERFLQESPVIATRSECPTELNLSATLQMAQNTAIRVEVPVTVSNEAILLEGLNLNPAGLEHKLSQAEFEDDSKKKATIYFLAGRSCLEAGLREHALLLFECAGRHFPESTMVREQLENLRQTGVQRTTMTAKLQSRLGV